MDYPSQVVASSDESVLRRIMEPGIRMAIYERPAPPGVRGFLARQTREQLFHAGMFPGKRGFRWRPHYHYYHWDPYLELFEDVWDFHPVVADARKWAVLLGQLAGPGTYVAFRVNRHEYKAPLHKDASRLTLLVRYQGSCMRYFRSQDVVPWGSEVPTQFYRARPGALVYRVPLFAVTVMKGVLWEGGPEDALVHVGGIKRERDRPGVLFIAQNHPDVV